MTAKTATTAEIAAELNTTPRELRKFLRADAKVRNATDSLPGKGSRYALPSTKTAIATLNKRFIAWSASQAESRKAVKVTESDNEVNEVDADIEPTDAELDMLDDEVEEFEV